MLLKKKDQMRPIFTAFILLVLSTGVSVAAEAPVAHDSESTIILSCDGTITTVGSKALPMHITNMRVVVNLSSQVVVGFGDIISDIDRADAAGIAFSGERHADSPAQNRRPIGGIKVVGFLDRVDGDATATVTASDLDSMSKKKYDIRCKRVSSLIYIEK